MCASVVRRKGLEQLTKACKVELVLSVNDSFESSGLARSYTQNKLETWTGNSLYRWRCIQKQHKPQSWRPKGELAAAAVPAVMLMAPVRGPMKRAAQTVHYRNIRPRAKSFLMDESKLAMQSSAELAGANRLVALSAVCVATLQNAPLAAHPAAIDLQFRSMQPWNSSQSAARAKEGALRRPQNNEYIRAL